MAFRFVGGYGVVHFLSPIIEVVAEVLVGEPRVGEVQLERIARCGGFIENPLGGFGGDAYVFELCRNFPLQLDDVDSSEADLISADEGIAGRDRRDQGILNTTRPS